MAGGVLAQDLALGGFVELLVKKVKGLFSFSRVGRESRRECFCGLSEIGFDVEVVHQACTALFEVLNGCLALRH